MTDERIKSILQESKRIAVVGISKNQERPSYHVSEYLKDQGYELFFVNPTADEIMGQKVYASLGDIPVSIDVVDVFRKPEDVQPIAREAVEIGAKVLWLQEGIVNAEAEKLAREAGLEVIMDRCMLKEHQRLL